LFPGFLVVERFSVKLVKKSSPKCAFVQLYSSPMSACCSCSTSANSDCDVAPLPPERVGEWMRMVFAALVAGQSMIFGLAVSISPPDGSARMIIHTALAASAVIVFALVGLPLLGTAWRALLQRRIVIEQLFLAGIFGAFFASVHCSLTGIGHVYYEVVAILLAIYTFGQLIGEQRREAAIAAARKLGTEFASCEKVLPDGSVENVEVEVIVPGDVVRVAAGAGIPVDGVVQRGTSFVRESALTGEAFPVVKREGDVVRAGSYCLDQALEIRATAAGRGRVLDQLLAMVQGAQSGKSQLQHEADRLVAWFLPAVLVISVLTFAGWTWAAGWERGLFNALAVLVVACPCSMGLATPVGIWAALGALTRRGIVGRTSDLVEALGRTDTVVFDKTGTLGEEHLELVDFVSAPGVNREELLNAVAAIEASSKHPVAMGFRRAGVGLAEVTRPIPGTGIEGEWQGRIYQIGNAGLLCGVGAGFETALRNELLDGGNGSHEVWVICDGKLAGLGVLRERLKDSARSAVEELHAMGVRCIVMTGDSAEATSAHGFAEAETEMAPADKARRVAELRAEGHNVLFVGDGVNDAPAMAEANAALAVGTGSALARETAGGLLTSEDLHSVPASITRCRGTLRAIRRNLWFAAAYNLVGISLAAGGVIHPVVAALLMLFSSLTVTWQALRETRDDEGTTQAVRPVPAIRRKNQERVHRLPSWVVNALGIGVVAQGPVISYLGGFPGMEATGFILIFFAAGLLVWALLRQRPVTSGAGMAATMFSLGGLLMLVGWWMDAGFAAVVRGGVCLCGCAASDMGWGLFLQPNWMAGGMLLAAVPTIFFEPALRTSSRVSCWFAGLVGMFLGMELSALAMALVPVQEAAAGLHFFATYAVMVLGMSWGMFAACRAWQWNEVRKQNQEGGL
jgi:heavy metal translocating P-type ATPase